MNEFYPLIQETIKNYSDQAVIKLYQELQQNPGLQITDFGCKSNIEYVLKRLINACLSRQSNIKFNAFITLSLLFKYYQQNKESFNASSIYTFIIAQSNYKKHCAGKPSEIEAYIIGKILIFKALLYIFKANINVCNHLVQIFTQFPEFQQQIIELINYIATDKKSKLIFKNINPNTQSGFVLKMLLTEKDLQKLNENTIDKILLQQSKNYPKKSICLEYIGRNLSKIFNKQNKYIEIKFTQIFNNEQNVNYKQLYYVLYLLKHYLSSIQINEETFGKIINQKIINYWLSQIKVQNKKIRVIAQSIKINVTTNSEFCYSFLQKLHKQKVNLTNININHPLYSVYQNVQPTKYVDFLISIIQQQSTDIQNQEENIKHYNQLQFFTNLRIRNLKNNQIIKIITIFLNLYHQNKNQLKIQSINSIINTLIGHQSTRKPVINQTASLILSKIQLENIQNIQNLQQLKNMTKFIRKIIKQQKQNTDQITVTFLNFLTATGYYLLIFNQQIQIITDLQHVFKDLKTNYLNKEQGLITSKKRKLNNEDKQNPIHILVDIFISLLTKSPHFLRNSINHLFVKIIPFLDSFDLSHLLDVIQRPDKQYIQDEQNKEE